MDKKTPSKKTDSKQKTKTTTATKEHSFSGTIGKDKIAVRAYFISERRRQLGWDGNEVSDWVEAEQQLLAETSEKSAEKKK